MSDTRVFLGPAPALHEPHEPHGLPELRALVLHELHALVLPELPGLRSRLAPDAAPWHDAGLTSLPRPADGPESPDVFRAVLPPATSSRRARKRLDGPTSSTGYTGSTKVHAIENKSMPIVASPIDTATIVTSGTTSFWSSGGIGW